MGSWVFKWGNAYKMLNKVESWTQGKSSIWKTNQAAETKEKKSLQFSWGLMTKFIKENSSQSFSQNYTLNL